jgi:DNA repair ATPase RecN
MDSYSRIQKIEERIKKLRELKKKITKKLKKEKKVAEELAKELSFLYLEYHDNLQKLIEKLTEKLCKRAKHKERCLKRKLELIVNNSDSKFVKGIALKILKSLSV